MSKQGPFKSFVHCISRDYSSKHSDLKYMRKIHNKNESEIMNPKSH
jgi:hypothetical protein